MGTLKKHQNKTKRNNYIDDKLQISFGNLSLLRIKSITTHYCDVEKCFTCQNH